MKNFAQIVEKAKKHDDYWIAGVMIEFTEMVCKLLDEQKMTRTELAEKLNVSSAYITKLLRGNANVTLKTIVRLARVFGKEINIEFQNPNTATNKLTVIVQNKYIPFKKKPDNFSWTNSEKNHFSHIENITKEKENEIKSIAA